MKGALGRVQGEAAWAASLRLPAGRIRGPQVMVSEEPIQRKYLSGGKKIPSAPFC